MLKKNNAEFVIAQFSDSHLFADKLGLHHGVNVYNNLVQVVTHLANNTALDAIIFTGDLTQDHSDISYQHFADVIYSLKLRVPVLYLAGNHDEPTLLSHFLASAPFNANKTITTPSWQVQLINSKSETPAGFVQQSTLLAMENSLDEQKNQLVFMHHHPVDVGYFIDKHGLENKQEFWQFVAKHPSISAIACGHVHRASDIDCFSTSSEQCVKVFTCPATSIQFDPNSTSVAALPDGPAYSVFYLFDNGEIHRKIIHV